MIIHHIHMNKHRRKYMNENHKDIRHHMHNRLCNMQYYMNIQNENYMNIQNHMHNPMYNMLNYKNNPYDYDNYIEYDNYIHFHNNILQDKNYGMNLLDKIPQNMYSIYHNYNVNNNHEMCKQIDKNMSIHDNHILFRMNIQHNLIDNHMNIHDKYIQFHMNIQNHSCNLLDNDQIHNYMCVNHTDIVRINSRGRLIIL